MLFKDVANFWIALKNNFNCRTCSKNNKKSFIKYKKLLFDIVRRI